MKDRKIPLKIDFRSISTNDMKTESLHLFPFEVVGCNFESAAAAETQSS